jgi:hypothetical protein
MALVLSAAAVSTGAKHAGKTQPTSDDPQSVAALEGLHARLSWSGRRVVAVDLAGNAKAHSALAHLGGLPNLVGLNLRGTDIADDDLASLERLSTLKKLDLGGTKITSDGVAHLAGLVGLTALDLSGTHVDDSALAHLEGLIRLASLNVNGTRVTREALRQLGLSVLDHLPGIRTRWHRAGHGRPRRHDKGLGPG